MVIFNMPNACDFSEASRDNGFLYLWPAVLALLKRRRWYVCKYISSWLRPPLTFLVIQNTSCSFFLFLCRARLLNTSLDNVFLATGFER